MRAPGGYLTITDPDGPTPFAEFDTISCGHCHKIVLVKPRTASTIYLIPLGPSGQFREEPGAFCLVCMRPVCLPCHGDGRCLPWERRLARSEARDRLRRAAGV
jgi:hypothetical protein